MPLTIDEAIDLLRKKLPPGWRAEVRLVLPGSSDWERAAWSVTVGPGRGPRVFDTSFLAAPDKLGDAVRAAIDLAASREAAPIMAPLDYFPF